MKALILSCGTGGGHNAAGRAIKEELERRGDSVLMLNPYDLAGKHTAKRIDETYIKTVQAAPRVFGAVYSAGNAYRNLPFRSPVYFANAAMTKKLQKLFEKERPDVVFMPHIFPAEIITNMKNRGMAVPKTVFIATDYTCIPFTEETDCDAFVIPSNKLTAEFLRRGIPRDKLYPLGIPVSLSFSEPSTREKAAEITGLDKNKRYILISGGSMGAGKLVLAIKLLYDRYKNDKKIGLVVICGSNKWLYNRLAGRYPDKITAVRFTDKMASYMRMAEVFITKPGGLSATEGAVLGVPMVHIMSIPGCETLNMRFFAQHGMSVPVKRIGMGLPNAADRLLNKAEAEKITANQRKYINPNAAADICRLAEKLINGGV